MKTFIGKPKLNQEVRHINGIPTDNRLENLKYGTRTENILDVYYQGKRWRKLRISEAREIKNFLSKGKTVQELAKEYDISASQIYKIKERRSYSWDL